MKILIVQSAGKHKANENFRECLCMQRGLQAIGVECDVWGRGYPEYEKPLASIVGAYSAVLIIENYHAEWLPDMAGIKPLKLFWSIDSHIALHRHQALVSAHKVDVVLNSTSRFVKAFKKCYWFPNAYDDTLMSPLNIKKAHNVGFCGNIVNRGNWIKQLQADVKMKVEVMVIGANMVRAINSYRIHWNRNYSSDINYRTFETLGCKTALLTNETDRLKDLFDIGKHLVTYKDYNDCKAKIAWLLKDAPARERIAAAGYEHAKKNHTYKNRAARLVEIIKENV